MRHKPNQVQVGEQQRAFGWENVMVRTTLAILAFLIVPTVSQAQCDNHGTARWPVKTSAISTADNDAHTLTADAFVHAQDLDINSQDVPNDSFISQDAQIGNATVREGQLVQVSGYISDVRCEKGDGDYHADFRADDSVSGACAEVEVPNPDNIADQNTKARVSEARQAFDGWLNQQTPVHVTLIGQLFYDYTHHSATDPGGGRGAGHCAATLWEIHPLLKVFVLNA
jgi:hypothetical protein